MFFCHPFPSIIRDYLIFLYLIGFSIALYQLITFSVNNVGILWVRYSPYNHNELAWRKRILNEER